MANNGIQLMKLFISLLSAYVASFIGSIFTSSSVESWYDLLIKPPITPPGWIIGTVWAFLYTFMGVAAFLVWNKGWSDKEVKIGLILFVGQLIVNILWSAAFFGLQSPLAGVITILILWIMVFLTTYQFNKVSRLAATIMIPYLVWVSFAGALNFWIFLLN